MLRVDTRVRKRLIDVHGLVCSAIAQSVSLLVNNCTGCGCYLIKAKEHNSELV